MHKPEKKIGANLLFTKPRILMNVSMRSTLIPHQSGNTDEDVISWIPRGLSHNSLNGGKDCESTEVSEALILYGTRIGDR